MIKWQCESTTFISTDLLNCDLCHPERWSVFHKSSLLDKGTTLTDKSFISSHNAVFFVSVLYLIISFIKISVDRCWGRSVSLHNSVSAFDRVSSYCQSFSVTEVSVLGQTVLFSCTNFIVFLKNTILSAVSNLRRFQSKSPNFKAVYYFRFWEYWLF